MLRTLVHQEIQRDRRIYKRFSLCSKRPTDVSKHIKRLANILLRVWIPQHPTYLYQVDINITVPLIFIKLIASHSISTYINITVQHDPWGGGKILYFFWSLRHGPRTGGVGVRSSIFFGPWQMVHGMSRWFRKSGKFGRCWMLCFVTYKTSPFFVITNFFL